MTARRCWDGGSEITAESGIEGKRGVRGGENCIRSNHICERHRALRNQLNEEKLAEGGSSDWRVERVKEGEKENGEFEERGLRGIPRAHCSVKWMKRGKTKRQTAKDGTCNNQGISGYTCIFFLQSVPSFLLIYFVAWDFISSSSITVLFSLFFFYKEFIKRRFDKKCKTFNNENAI